MTAPIRLRDRLRAAVDGPRRVVHRGEHAVYVDLDGEVAGVIAARASRVPCALWSAATDLPSVGICGDRAEVRGGRLVIDGQQLQVGRLTDLRVRRHPALRPSGHQLSDEHLVALIGLGPGLTPLGDDIVCGWLVARHAAGLPDVAVSAAVRRLAARTTPLSAALLDCATRGEALPELAAWLRERAGLAASSRGLAASSRGPAASSRGLRASSRELAAVGATSGAGLLTGARLALEPLSEGVAGHRADICSSLTNPSLEQPTNRSVA